MNLKNILWVRNTGKIMPSASVQENLFGLKLNGGSSGVEKTATGNPVSIVTNKAQNAISTLISFNSDTGYSEINLNGCGKNLFRFASDRQRYIWSDGCGFEAISAGDSAVTIFGQATETHYFAVANSQIVIPKGTYTLSLSVYNKISCTLQDTETSTTIVTVGNSPVTFTLTKDTICRFSTITIRNGMDFGDEGEEIGIQIEVGQTVTDYEPYTQGANITVTLGDTYYEGTLDLENGVLTADGQTVSLTPQTVALLAGANTLWTDGDSLSVTYMAKK